MRNVIVNLFWNSAEKRIRSLWRLILQFILLVVFSIIATAPFLLLGGSLDNLVGTAIGSAVAFPISLWLAGRFLDYRPFRDFGFRFNAGWWRQLIFGLLLGALLMFGVFLIELIAGWITVEETFYVVEPNNSFALAYLMPIIVYISVGFYEELWSRGYHLTNIAEGLNFPQIGERGAIVLALLISSIMFGVLHAGNPNATVVSTINISLAGILLGLGFILTGELAIPIGLHITWNFFQGNVFGFPVSGTSMIGASIFKIEQGGPAWFTGGAFGPEAGVIGLIAMAIGCALTVAFVRWEQGTARIDQSIAFYPTKAQLHESDFSAD